MEDRFRLRMWNTNHFVRPIDKGYDPSKATSKLGYYEPRMEEVAGFNISTGKISLGGARYFKLKEDDVLMQCTGIKDKNGKLIYEGDIVEDIDGNAYMLKFDKRLLGVVIANKQNTFMITSTYILKVIGNIFENPELLDSETVLFQGKEIEI